jgi:hypothetical protein
VRVFHFPPFAVFLPIFQVLLCAFLIFHLFSVSRLIPASTMCVSHFPPFSEVFFFCIILGTTMCISHFHFPHCFSPYFQSYSVCFSFSFFFQLSHLFPGSTVYISHFPCFGVFLPIFQVKHCLCLIFHVSPYSSSYSVHFHFSRFYCFSTYSRSYGVCFSFSTFFQVSCHNPGPTVCISHFSLLSVFLTLFHVLQSGFFFLF